MQLSAVFHIVMIHWVLTLYGCMDGAMILSLPGRNIECWLSDRGGDDLLLAGDGVDLPLRDSYCIMYKYSVACTFRSIISN